MMSLKLKSDSLIWALDHAINYGDTDVFPLPFEYEALKYNWPNVENDLKKQNILKWITRPHRILFSPKDKYAFRVITQLDPLDFIIFSSLIYEISNDLEKFRISIDENRVFSYRVETNKNGQLFNPQIGYKQFLEECRNKIKHSEYVVTADISDFYPRIYHHRLENQLYAATNNNNHVKAIMHLLSSWNERESYGIPIGNAPSRLLAEITLSNVDEALLDLNIDFVRFNDDYRIFANNETEAFHHLIKLADLLYKIHGLTLQPQKTRIYTITNFEEKFLHSPDDKELDSLHEKFYEFISQLGFDSIYEPIDYESLSEDEKTEIDKLNLLDLLKSEINDGKPDYSLIRFLLRRLGQLNNKNAIDTVINNIHSLLPIIPDIVEYFLSLDLHPDEKNSLGKTLINLLENKDSLFNALPYHRMWILYIFSQSSEWDNQNKFIELYESEENQECKRKLILAMGRAKKTYWFQQNRRYLFEFPPWVKRAFIVGSSCLTPDARKHFFASIENKLKDDILEYSIWKWAKENPF